MGAPYHDEETLRELYHVEGLSTAEIADRFGTSQSTISRWLSRHGIETRSFGEHQIPDKLRDGDWLRTQHFDMERTIADIADDVGCSWNAVKSAFDRHGIENWRSNKLSDDAGATLEDESELRRLYFDEEMSQSDIAELLGVDQGTVSNWFHRHGIGARPQSYYTGERHPRYNPEASPHVYDIQWRKVRETVIERDGSECQKCGISREEHIDRQEMDLDVHHITPQHEVDDKYDTENLITMCRSCHIEVEQSNEDAAIHIQGGV